MKRYFLLLIIGMITVLNVYSQRFSGGDGTEQNPYLISSKADMEAWAREAEDSYVYNHTYFQLTNDITGINTCINFFNGIFDGNGFTIEIDNASSGVFGQLSDATIKNLGVKGKIRASGVYAAGGIARLIRSSTYITNCYNVADISVFSSYNSVYAGGICALYDDSFDVGTCHISNCYNVGNITVVNSTSQLYGSYSYAGGISGYESTITNCYNTGIISSTTMSDLGGGYPYAGGICARYGNITSSFSAASRMIAQRKTTAWNGNVGKIDGGSGIINNCYALSTMIINSSLADWIGQQNGTAATLADFQSQEWLESTLNWDFKNVWEMSDLNDPVYKGLPKLLMKKEIQNYVITASAGSGGSISPGGTIYVSPGESQTFTFTPFSGYEINQVLIDGVNNQTAVSAGNYTFNSVNASHTISVTFKQKNTQQDFSGGNGTEENPYLISSREDMELLAKKVNEGELYYRKHFRLTRDLTYPNDTVSTIIGGPFNNSWNNAFFGNFDGNGHQIAVKIRTANRHVGLFGAIQQAHIANLCISGSIELQDDATFDRKEVGGICGWMYLSDIENCCNKATITAIHNSNAGGICGEMSQNSSISNSYNTGYLRQGGTIGGICGSTSGSENYFCKISQCYNVGNISGSDNLSHCGGIIGNIATQAIVTISNCYNMGNISISSVSPSSLASGHLGGICGNNAWGWHNSNALISNCYSVGYLSATSYPGNVSETNLGGICGSYGNVKNSFVVNAFITNEFTNSNTGRIGGLGGSYSNCYAESSSVYLNGNTINNNDASSNNGQDILLTNLQNQSWIQNHLQWDFQTVWKMPDMNDPVHKGLPILKGINNVTDIPVINQNELVFVSVFPNPTKGELFFKSDNPIKKLEICNVSGSCIFVRKNINDKINISDLPNGMYLVRVYTDKGSIVKKIIKNK